MREMIITLGLTALIILDVVLLLMMIFSFIGGHPKHGLVLMIPVGLIGYFLYHMLKPPKE